MQQLINFPIPVILPEYSSSFVNKEGDKANRHILNQIQAGYPYLISSTKMIWEGKSLSWRQRCFSNNYSFKDVKFKWQVAAVSWCEHIVYSLPLMLMLRRNGLLREELLTEVLSNTKGKKNLVFLSFGKYKSQDCTQGKIVESDYAWRLFFNNKQDLIAAFVVCEFDQQDSAIQVLLSYTSEDIKQSAVESFPYSFHLKEKLLGLLSRNKTSSFSLWMDKTFKGQLETPAELPDIIDHCYDEIKMTGLSAWSYHQLFRWFGEDMQQVGYNAFDYYVRSRDGKNAWEDSLKDYLDTYNFPKEIKDSIFQNYIIALLKFF